MIFLGSLFNISQKSFLTGNHLYWAVPGLCIAFFNIYHRVSLLFDPRIHDGLYVQILAHLGGWKDSLRDLRFEEGLGRESWGPSAVPRPPFFFFFASLIPLSTKNAWHSGKWRDYQTSIQRGQTLTRPQSSSRNARAGVGGDGKKGKEGKTLSPTLSFFPSPLAPLRRGRERETTLDESGKANCCCSKWIQIWKFKNQFSFNSFCWLLKALKVTEKIIRENAF